jgi:hypothetical protein
MALGMAAMSMADATAARRNAVAAGLGRTKGTGLVTAAVFLQSGGQALGWKMEIIWMHGQRLQPRRYTVHSS